MSAHTFDPEIAAQVGCNAAVIYQNIYFWTEKNFQNGKQVKDGYVWSYNSRSAFAKLFPYMTASQIKTAISKLIKAGLLVKGDYNKANYDKTNWYACAVSKEWLSPIGQKSPMDEAEIANGLAKNRQPIPDNKPDNKPDIPQTPKGAFVFEAMWREINPKLVQSRRGGKDKARKAFNSKSKAHGEVELANAMRGFYRDPQNTREKCKYAPAIVVALRGDKFEPYLGYADAPRQSSVSRKFAALRQEATA